MRANLPTRQMGFAAMRVEFFLAHYQNAVIVGAALVGRGKARGAFRNRAIANQLDRSDTHPLIAKACAVSGGDHRIEVMKIDEAVSAVEQIARLVSVLIRKK